MLRRARTRLIHLLPVFLMLTGCAAGPVEIVEPVEMPIRCGVRAALDSRQPEALQDSPPACALPSADEVALSCAVRDRVTSPDYEPPAYDAEGFPIDARPTPEYRVSALSCRFTSPDRNRADCQFRLAIPNGEGEPKDLVASFEHEFWQDHGPSHYVYGTRWSVTDRCAPADP